MKRLSHEELAKTKNNESGEELLWRSSELFIDGAEMEYLVIEWDE